MAVSPSKQMYAHAHIFLVNITFKKPAINLILNRKKGAAIAQENTAK